MKRSYKAWALVLGSVLSTQTFAGKWLYTVQNAQIDLLPSPFKVGGFSEARDINIHGQIVGWAETSGPKPNAWLYEPSGVYKNVGIPLTDTEARAVSINNLGEVVGTWVDNAMRRGFYWHPSTGFASLATELYPGEVYNERFHFDARAINDFGRIVGVSEQLQGSGLVPLDICHVQVPIYWIRPDARPQILFCPPGYWGEATDLNNYGWTGGFQHGSPTDLGFGTYGFRHETAPAAVPMPAGGKPSFLEVLAINESAAVVGRVIYPTAENGHEHGFYWDGISRTSVLLPVLSGGSFSFARDVNDEHFVVGQSSRIVSTEAGFVYPLRAFLWWADFGMYELPVPVAADSAKVACGANAMTNFLPASATQGTILIVGYCAGASLANTAARWTLSVSRSWVP